MTSNKGGFITSEIGQSKASMTNLASSLRDDDLLISASQVDPQEKSMRARSKLDATDLSKSKILKDTVENLAI